jgi:hypothetical protein
MIDACTRARRERPGSLLCRLLPVRIRDGGEVRTDTTRLLVVLSPRFRYASILAAEG